MIERVQRLLAAALAPIQRRLTLMVVRGVVELTKSDTAMQSLQLALEADNLRDDIEHFEPYGFTSHADDGAEAIVLHVGGNGDHPVCIIVADRRTRPTDLENGEVALWTKDNGVRVLLKANGDVEIGTEPTEKAVRADRNDARLDDIESFLANHIHSAGTLKDSLNSAVTGNSGTATGAPSGASTACDEVFIK